MPKEVMMVFKDKDAFRLSRSAEDREKDKGKIFTIRLNAKETTQLAKDMKILNQVKPSTCLKQLALIGSFVLHNDKIGLILSYIMGNLRRNQALGILDPTTEIDLNVTQNKENCDTTN